MTHFQVSHFPSFRTVRRIISPIPGRQVSHIPHFRPIRVCPAHQKTALDNDKRSTHTMPRGLINTRALRIRSCENRFAAPSRHLNAQVELQSDSEPQMGSAATFSIANEFSEVGRLPQHCYGAYDPSPVVSSRICLASSTNEPGTSTSLGPADKKSGASKPAARWISEGMPASFSTPSIRSARDSSGAAATFTHLSTMHASYPRLFTEARGRRVLRTLYPGWCIAYSIPYKPTACGEARQRLFSRYEGYI